LLGGALETPQVNGCWVWNPYANQWVWNC
jgi:hypothetical protein